LRATLIGPPQLFVTIYRVNPVETLEQVCSDAWPPMEQRRLGEWRLRWAGGFTGRANSALAIGDPGMPLAEAFRAVCDFAHSHDIPPAVQAVKGSAVEAEILAEGWRENVGHSAGHEVSVLVGDAVNGTSLAKNARKVTLTASMNETPTPGWWELSAGTTEPTPAQRHVLGTGDNGYGVAEVGGVTAGAVRVAVVGRVAHLSRLAVRPEFRRRGLAAGLMFAASSWAKERGAGRDVLQVSVSNGPALALYRELGFTEHHRYRYWVPPMATCKDRKS
jgi:ribosomal protein S18 acetylase RimI-like enzyme